MVKKRTDDDQPEDEDGSGGDEGGSDGSAGGGTTGTGGATGGGTWIPNYYELLGLTTDEKELSDLAGQALFEQRISIKSQGYEVTALEKMQKLRNRLQEPGLDNSPGGGGSGFEEHPELPEMDGAIDPNQIVLPESEAAERSNDPKLQLQLKQRMAAKFGMSQNISIEAMKEEYKKKMELRSHPVPRPENTPEPPEPTPTPRFRPRNAPKPY